VLYGMMIAGCRLAKDRAGEFVVSQSSEKPCVLRRQGLIRSTYTLVTGWFVVFSGKGCVSRSCFYREDDDGSFRGTTHLHGEGASRALSSGELQFLLLFTTLND
jgi:hypothetical protein